VTAPGQRGALTHPASAGAEVVLPLAEAKLAVPALRGRVQRKRIQQSLAEGPMAGLTLVAAPAGYAKTTAVLDWCESLDAGFAWVTLDAGDNDPIRLWTYVATAVDRVRQGLGRAALEQLRASGSLNEQSVDALMNGLAAVAKPLVLVLDDLQAVTDPDGLAAIDHALEYLPANVRIVAITRSDPALRIAQLRAGGKLKELRADELAFTVAETRALLVEHIRVSSTSESSSGTRRSRC
jgi:LuxR family maltose regulon positive regulatory protein